jgi:hypothetical protein
MYAGFARLVLHREKRALRRQGEGFRTEAGKMRQGAFVIAAFLLSVFVSAQGTGQKESNSANDQATQEQRFLARRQNFTSGRELLLSKRVPFDPDELLRDDWRQKLKSTLDAMPEMHQVRHEKVPLSGAYLADTLYLPEKVQLSGHTLILANYVVFEGKAPEIKGNFDLHFFPRKRVAVLNTSLAEVLRQEAGVLEVKFRGKGVFPSFDLLKDSVGEEKHEITFDVSGLPPEFERRQPPKSGSQLQNTAGNRLKNCSLRCKRLSIVRLAATTMLTQALQVHQGFLLFLRPQAAQMAGHRERTDHVLQAKAPMVLLVLSAARGRQVPTLETVGWVGPASMREI